MTGKPELKNKVKFKEVTMNGKVFSYLEYGKDNKEVIICLHGYGDTAKTFIKLGEALSKSYRIIAVNYPMVEKSKANEKQTLSSLTEHVTEFVKAMGFTPKVIITGKKVSGTMKFRFLGKDIDLLDYPDATYIATISKMLDTAFYSIEYYSLFLMNLSLITKDPNEDNFKDN